MDNQTKKVKLIMILTGIIAAIALILLFSLNSRVWKLSFILQLVFSFVIIFLWILLNIILISIALKKNNKD